MLSRWDVVFDNFYCFSNLEKLVVNFFNKTENFNSMIFKMILKICKKLKDWAIENYYEFDDIDLILALDR